MQVLGGEELRHDGPSVDPGLNAETTGRGSLPDTPDIPLSDQEIKAIAAAERAHAAAAAAAEVGVLPFWEIGPCRVISLWVH